MPTRKSSVGYKRHVRHCRRPRVRLGPGVVKPNLVITQVSMVLKLTSAKKILPGQTVAIAAFGYRS